MKTAYRECQRPLGDGHDASRALIYEDLPLSQMPPDLRTQLEVFPYPSFLGSLGHCESYEYPPTQQVACLRDASGEVRQSFFYNEKKWAGVFKELEIVGPINRDSRLLQCVLAKRQPDLLTLRLQAGTNLPNHIDDFHFLGARRTVEDYIVELPVTPQEYLQRLGKQTRKHLPYYVRRLQRELGERYAVRVAIGNEISWESFFCLLQLNRLRMRTKGRASLWTSEMAEHRWQLVRRCGFVVSVCFEDTIVAGTLSLLYRGKAYLITIAHDPKYDHWNLGNICLWLTIERLITLEYSAFHLLWGACFYKSQFGGKLEPFYEGTYSSNSSAAAAWRLSRFLRVPAAKDMLGKIRRRVSWHVASVR